MFEVDPSVFSSAGHALSKHVEPPMNFNRFAFAFGLLSLIGSAWAADTAAQAELRSVLQARLTQISNLYVRYRTEELYAAPAKSITLPGGGRMSPLIGAKVLEESFSLLVPNCMVDSRMSKQGIESMKSGIGAAGVEIYTLVKTASRVETLVRQPGDKDLIGMVENGDVSAPRTLVIDVALGLRREDGTKWMLPAELNNMSLELKGGDIELRDLDDHQRTHVWIYSRTPGLPLRTYRVYTPPDNMVNVEIINDDFREVDGQMLPFTIVYRIQYFEGKQRFEPTKKQLSVAEYRLNDPENRTERYRLRWPAGTHLKDARSDQPFLIEKEGILRDEDIHQMLIKRADEERAQEEAAQKRIESIHRK